VAEALGDQGMSLRQRLPERVLGRSGIVVSDVGFGCWALGGPDSNLDLDMGWGDADDEVSREALRTAFDLGVTHFDTADVYGHGRSERVLGTLLKMIPRDRVIVGTKVGYFSGTAPHPFDPLHMRHQLEMSLANLGTSYIDIYYLHNLDFGPDDRYLDAAIVQMKRFKDQGRVRAIGMRGPHRHALERAGRMDRRGDKTVRFFQVASVVQPEVIQVRYNMLTPEVAGGQDVFSWASERRIGVVINKPLAQGLLTGKYDPISPPSFPRGDHRRRKRWFRADALAAVQSRLALLRQRFGIETSSLVSIAIEYCLRKSESCCVLTGIRTPAQAAMNLRTSRRTLTEQDIAFIIATFGNIDADMGEYFEHAD
jgi:methylglyoxal reductase